MEREYLNSSLRFVPDVSGAKRLRVNSESQACFQGQNHGHQGFLLTPEWASGLFEENKKYRDVVLPFLTVDDMLSSVPPSPKRYVIDFHPRHKLAAAKYATPFAIVKKLVLPDREKAAAKEQERNLEVLRDDPNAKVNHHHENSLKQWWLLSWAHGEMLQRISRLPRYIACGHATSRPVFEFVAPQIHPNAGCLVFPLSDDYSFGILQSDIHRTWFISKCSTFTDLYSSNGFDTFPWPQSPSVSSVRRVANASRLLRAVRRKRMDESGLSLRELYRLIETPGESRLRAAHEELDKAVRAAYRITAKRDTLAALLDLNLRLAFLEARGARVQGPGLPAFIQDSADFISTDRMEIQPPQKI